MVAVPADTPVTFPNPSTVATEVELLLHEPPVVLQLNALAAPSQADSVPVMAAGFGLTVTDIVLKQPVDGKV